MAYLVRYVFFIEFQIWRCINGEFLFMNTVGGILIAENVELLKFDTDMQFLCQNV